MPTAGTGATGQTLTSTANTSLPYQGTDFMSGNVPPVNVAPTPTVDPNATIGQRLSDSVSNVAGKAGDKFSEMGRGLEGIVKDSPGARDRFLQTMGGKSGAVKSGLAASAPILSESMQPEPMTSYSDTGDRNYETYLDRMGLRRTRRSFAEGGLADASLSNKSGLGSLIKGDSDGMADEILAKVSPGEYIITAQAVSALGNGNTDAGAKKLDGMMDRIYEMQTGEPKQMKEIDAKKVMVA